MTIEHASEIGNVLALQVWDFFWIASLNAPN